MNTTILCRLAYLSFGLMSTAQASAAATADEEYTLSERCLQNARAHWESTYKNEAEKNKTSTWVDYENHYSRKLGKCFFMEIRATDQSDGRVFMKYQLFDFLDHKGIGFFWGFQNSQNTSGCKVKGTVCSNKIEWDILIRPYMEE